jgi:hypothetical protein
MVVPSIVIRDYDLFDLLLGVLIDAVGWCRGGETDSDAPYSADDSLLTASLA